MLQNPSDGDKILLAALITLATVIISVLKQSTLITHLIDQLGKSIALRIDQSSKWECKYKPKNGGKNGPQEPGTENQPPLPMS